MKEKVNQFIYEYIWVVEYEYRFYTPLYSIYVDKILINH